jgi:hypothetical protein
MSTARANLAASVRQRLLNLAKERNEDFEQILVRYALERLLYRLSRSAHAERFVLKGALLFRLWFEVVKLGAFNSRLKDYFDLRVLMRYERIDAASVVRAVQATFARRGTPLPEAVPAGLTDEFARSKQAAWNAFLRRSGLEAPTLAEVVAALRVYASRIFNAARAGT